MNSLSRNWNRSSIRWRFFWTGYLVVEEEHEDVGDLAVEEASDTPDEVSDVIGHAIGHRSGDRREVW